MNDVDPEWLTAADSEHTRPADVARYYDQWAAGYDNDLAAWDYRAPVRAASLLRRHGPEAHRVLDAGCGTGMAGLALRDAGFDGELHGIDLSAASLDLAQERGVYQSLRQADLQQPLVEPDKSYDALICVGVMTYVPDVEACWIEFCRVVAPAGVIVVTQREDYWVDRQCEAVVDSLRISGAWEPLLVTEPEPYLPDSPGDLSGHGVHYLVARVL